MKSSARYELAEMRREQAIGALSSPAACAAV